MVSIRYKLPCILYAISLVYASNIKGVEPKKQDLYKPSSEGSWTCLDGSKTIPHSAINDDYCDCLDGSDEPGTSACSNSLFYCANIGHVPAYIKSSSVNDGVCDEACCDGSDENGDLISCPNRCKEVGEAYRLEQSSLKKSTEAGLQVKKQLISDAAKQIILWQEEKAQIEDEIFLKKAHLLRLERERAMYDTQKKQEECESNSNEIDALKQAVVVLQKNVDQLKTILGDMKRDHNHNYHDMAVKGAITAYDEFVDRYGKIENEIKSQIEGKQDTPEQKEESTEEVNNEALENVNKLITDAENEISDMTSNLNRISEDLVADYGTDNEWLKLKDTCIEKDEGEYTYSLCILGDAHQISNKDKTRIHLGNFDHFDGYHIHSHTHGTRCWNGPDRSVKVFFECGLENEILSVTEPEKCEYHFSAKSPAVCQSIAEEEHIIEHKKPVHEEL